MLPAFIFLIFFVIVLNYGLGEATTLRRTGGTDKLNKNFVHMLNNMVHKAKTISGDNDKSIFELCKNESEDLFLTVTAFKKCTGERLLKILDINRDHIVQDEEYYFIHRVLDANSDLLIDSVEAKVIELFAKLDENSDGVLSLLEFKKVLDTNIGFKQPEKKDDFYRWFAYLNINRKCYMTIDKFIPLIWFWHFAGNESTLPRSALPSIDSLSSNTFPWDLKPAIGATDWDMSWPLWSETMVYGVTLHWWLDIVDPGRKEYDLVDVLSAFFTRGFYAMGLENIEVFTDKKVPWYTLSDTVRNENGEDVRIDVPIMKAIMNLKKEDILMKWDTIQASTITHSQFIVYGTGKEGEASMSPSALMQLFHTEPYLLQTQTSIYKEFSSKEAVEDIRLREFTAKERLVLKAIEGG